MQVLLGGRQGEPQARATGGITSFRSNAVSLLNPPKRQQSLLQYETYCLIGDLSSIFQTQAELKLQLGTASKVLQDWEKMVIVTQIRKEVQNQGTAKIPEGNCCPRFQQGWKLPCQYYSRLCDRQSLPICGAEIALNLAFQIVFNLQAMV